MDEDIKSLKKCIEPLHKESTRYAQSDAWCHNGGTALMLLCAGIATFLGVKGVEAGVWVAPFFTLCAAFLVAIDRALQFGPRWIHHRTVLGCCDSILAKLDTINVLPERRRGPELESIREEIINLLMRFIDLPGVDVDKRKPSDDKGNPT